MAQSEPDNSVDNPDWDSIQISEHNKVLIELLDGMHRFSHDAMATTFEIFIRHDDARYSKQAAQAAFEQLDMLEGELSRFVENSDISRINNHPAGQPLRVGPAAFDCLQICKQIYAETNGAFDVTIGALMRCWLDKDRKIKSPSQDQLEFARQFTGMHLIELDQAEHTVTKRKPDISTSLIGSSTIGSVRIDLGGFGKGYAIDRMTELVSDWSIDTFLIHGGGSSVLAFGTPAGTEGWPVTISNPCNHKQILARLCLNGRALSGSGLQQGEHIIDPRTAKPVKARLAAWASADTAAVADALSTAFMIMSIDEMNQYCISRPDTLAMIVTEDFGAVEKGNVLHFGLWKDYELLN